MSIEEILVLTIPTIMLVSAVLAAMRWRRRTRMEKHVAKMMDGRRSIRG